MTTNEILIALGSNLAGPWGQPCGAIGRALHELNAADVEVIAASSLYRTDPVGTGGMPRFCNAVAVVRSSLPAAGLLRLMKRLERSAGRRQRGKWGLRTLDLDIIDYRGRVIGIPGEWRPHGIILPHPRASERGFVLVPLAEVAPQWRHPRLRLTADQLLARRPGLRRGIYRA